MAAIMVTWIEGARQPVHRSSGSSAMLPLPPHCEPSPPLSASTDSTAALAIATGLFESSPSYMSFAFSIAFCLSRSPLSGGPREPSGAGRSLPSCVAMFLNASAAAPGSSPSRSPRQCRTPARSLASSPCESSAYQAALPGADIPEVVATIRSRSSRLALPLEMIRRTIRTISSWSSARPDSDRMYSATLPGLRPLAAHSSITVPDHTWNQNGLRARAASARKWACRSASSVSMRPTGSTSSSESPSALASDSSADIFQ